MSAENNLPPLPPITLRDWLAGQALPAVIESWVHDDSRTPSVQAIGLDADRLAVMSYAMADAMLAARESSHE